MAHKITEKTVQNAAKALVQAGEFPEDWKPNATNAKKIAHVILGEDKDGKQIKADKATIALVYDYIKPDEEDSADEGEESDADMGKVKTKYKTHYAKNSPTKTGCGDEFDVAFQEYTSGKDGKRLTGEDLLGKVKAAGNANGIDVMAKWGHLKDRAGNTNVGMIRMNLANVLRGRVNKGEKVTIGKKVWAADPTKQAAAKERRKKQEQKLADLKAKSKQKGKAAAKKPAKPKKTKTPAVPEAAEEGPQGEGAVAAEA